MNMGENKQEVLTMLLSALQATRNLHDLTSLTYIEEREIVVATFTGGNKIVNVWYLVLLL